MSWIYLESVRKIFALKRCMLTCTLLPLKYFSNERELVLDINNDSVRGGCGYLAATQADCNAWKCSMTRLSVHTQTDRRKEMWSEGKRKNQGERRDGEILLAAHHLFPASVSPLWNLKWSALLRHDCFPIPTTLKGPI